MVENYMKNSYFQTIVPTFEAYLYYYLDNTRHVFTYPHVIYMMIPNTLMNYNYFDMSEYHGLVWWLT